ncbi:rhodanese-like domain-containing protein [bacterium]|nr:rhodanese-like domain-containing protein [bacterium]
MKTNKILYFMLIVTLAFFMVGCDKAEDPINEFNVLVEYLEGTDGGYINNMGAWIKDLGAINTNDYFVLDIRATADYNNEHIVGAVNSTMAGMFDAVASATKPVLVVCYSGQTAAYAHVLLNLKGIEAYTLKWGMSIFSQAHDKWTANCSNVLANDANWTMDASATLPSYDYPELNTGKDKDDDILDAQIDAAIAKGLQLIAGTDVASNTAAYEIFNYWAQADYAHYGHIKDAYQLTPSTLKSSENLGAINSDETNVIYCWTGQTSAAVSAYLTVLGYDVKSLKFGANSMIYDELTASKWPKPYGG